MLIDKSKNILSYRYDPFIKFNYDLKKDKYFLTQKILCHYIEEDKIEWGIETRDLDEKFFRESYKGLKLVNIFKRKIEAEEVKLITKIKRIFT